MYLPQENNYCEVEPVDVQFKYWMNPKMIEVAIMHDEEEMIMRATVIDRSVSEGATSTKVEPFTDGRGYSRLGMKVPVFVVTDAVPGSYGRESWEIFLEITNFILKDFDNIKVIMVRTITRISGISVEDINHVLEDRQTRFWLNNLDSMMWNNPRMNPQILLLFKKAEMIELEMICMTGLAQPVMDEADIERFDEVLKVVRFMSRVLSKKWEREQTWRIFRVLQSIKAARVMFSINMKMRLLIMTTMEIGRIKDDQSLVEMETVSYEGRERILWPKLNRCFVEF